MARSFALPRVWRDRGWKLKIRDRERVEPPHVTFLLRTRSWRYGLRKLSFLDREPDPSEVPRALVLFVWGNLAEIIAAWDELYPHNRVRAGERTDDGEA